MFVTHDQAEALALADRMAVMERGVIRQLGTPTEVYRRPANTFVASFIGSTPMNLLDGTVRDGGVDVGGTRLPVPDGLAGRLTEGEAVVYGLRPEYLRFAAGPPPSGGGALAGEIQVVENLGSGHLVTLQGPAGLVQLVADEDLDLPLGATAHAVPRLDRVLLYRDGELLTPAPEPARETAA
ncbi:TOBE domain-containing protein [Streptomyces sp. 8K308]|uniref:TOBE domain-containing protein n=1 Tax=Streptomyces sp. 8K308 TaxID=2530388 RepID=UPI00269FC56B